MANELQKEQRDLIERVRDEVTGLRGQKQELLAKIKELQIQNEKHVTHIHDLEQSVGELQGRLTDIEKMLSDVLKIR